MAGGAIEDELKANEHLASDASASDAIRLCQSGHEFRRRFLSSHDEHDLDSAISSYEQAIALSSSENASLHLCHNGLGLSFLMRHDSLHDISSLDRAIEAFDSALSAIPESDKTSRNALGYLQNLGNALQSRFELTRDTQDIQRTINIQQRLLDLVSDHPGLAQASALNSLANSFILRFDETATLKDTEEAIHRQRQALELLDGIDLADADEDTRHEVRELTLSVLEGLAHSYQLLFERGPHDLADADEAIAALQKAFRALNYEDGTAKLRILDNLANALWLRFVHSGNVEDIDGAIDTRGVTVDLLLSGGSSDEDLPSLMSDLAHLLQYRFERTGDHDDLARAIEVQRKALPLIPDGDISIPGQLDRLANALRLRFERLNNFEDLEEAISLLRKAIQLCTADEGQQFEDKYMFFNDLGNSLQLRFESRGHLEDINEAISMQQEALGLLRQSREHDRARMLTNLALSFERRFQRTGARDDIERAASAAQSAVDLTDEGHPDMPGFLNNIASILRRRAEHVGDLADIEAAISAQQKALALTPSGHADIPRWLTNLGNSFMRRFERTGEMSDLEEAIQAHRKSVELTDDAHYAKASRFTNLGTSLQTLYEQSHDLTVIEEAIAVLREAVRRTPTDDQRLLYSLSALGTALQFRFIDTEDTRDLEEAIRVQRDACSSIAMDHMEFPVALSNLANSLHLQFFHTDDLQILEDEIRTRHQAIQRTPEGHAALSTRLSSLGRAHQARFISSKSHEDAEMAISFFRRAARTHTGPPSARFQAAWDWAILCLSSENPNTFEAYSLALDLLPQLVWVGQTIRGRLSRLKSLSSFSTEAVAAAISLGRYNTALEWFEQGRCIVWSQLNKLRTPLDDLRAVDEDLADEIMRISIKLENAGARSTTVQDLTDIGQKLSLQEEVMAHRRLAEQWEALLERVRSVPGFEEFLSPVRFAHFSQHAPHSGPVVIVNIHTLRCDALVLRHGVESALHIPLPQFSHARAALLQDKLFWTLRTNGVRSRSAELWDDLRAGRLATSRPVEIYYILSDLWSRVVKPILDGLGFEPSTQPPRMWWCTSGPLSFLPLHAAGVYGRQSPSIGAITSDYVVSSYIPTISTILNPNAHLRSAPKGILLVSQPNTPGLPPIPGTTKEVQAIKAQFSSSTIDVEYLDGKNATVERVLKAMENRDWIHFACHAIQHNGDPTKSAFYLHDGRLELSDIIKKALPKADFAFLSACQTGTGDQELSEEAVHLAAGMLTAGYRSVIATMWSVNDTYASSISQDVYTNLKAITGPNESLASTNAAFALHRAIKQLRKSKGDSESALLAWIPFIHMGA